VAKFSPSTDLYSVLKAEFIAMRLAELVKLAKHLWKQNGLPGSI
jgi:hypothetical protein